MHRVHMWHPSSLKKLKGSKKPARSPASLTCHNPPLGHAISSACPPTTFARPLVTQNSPNLPADWTELDGLSGSRPAEIVPAPAREHSSCQDMTTSAQALASGTANSRNASDGASQEHPDICHGSPQVFHTPATAFGEINMRSDPQRYHLQQTSEHCDEEVFRLGPPDSTTLELRSPNRHALGNDPCASSSQALYETANAVDNFEMSDRPVRIQQIRPFSSYPGIDPRILELNRSDANTSVPPWRGMEEGLDHPSPGNLPGSLNGRSWRRGRTIRGRSPSVVSESEEHGPCIATDEFDSDMGDYNLDSGDRWMYRRIVERRIEPSGRRMAKVEWVDTWEPESELEGLKSALQRYAREQRGKQGKRPGVRKRKGRP
ncbi:hypothetical protein EIK77_008806 [Talaromyces pinophilus]|nr:hypothetical protein EIK77_008806 [Talaromyces pinophilus]PCG88196.1 Hypothetical protein PENO1_111550 [Penicillium occitanis (nom. inval.)]PCG88258.1 hypothetical protein PENOC_111790 [Penicillium occitanis (nom. inval.)]